MLPFRVYNEDPGLRLEFTWACLGTEEEPLSLKMFSASAHSASWISSFLPLSSSYSEYQWNKK